MTERAPVDPYHGRLLDPYYHLVDVTLEPGTMAPRHWVRTFKGPAGAAEACLYAEDLDPREFHLVDVSIWKRHPDTPPDWPLVHGDWTSRAQVGLATRIFTRAGSRKPPQTALGRANSAAGRLG